MIIKNIIFDLGNVILNIDINKSEIEFKKHGLENFDQLYSLVSQTKIFDYLETGKISPQEFYSQLRQISNTDLDDKIIETCWNALILDFPPKRIELLLSLKNKYRIFLLSNTNAIHYEYYNANFIKEFGFTSFDEIFERAYYSHTIGFRKPDLQAFEFVLNDSKLKASETLFIDDNKENIEAAKQLGINTIWLPDNNLETLEILQTL